ncbi:MAG: cytochrome c nitrite reductase small subunit [Anaerolineales bacterium]|nr:cytochrome c nitrite reductase small subunit [Anaerolineales bacterium]
MRLALTIGILALIIVLGVGLYVTDFTAYLGNNPSTCNNCHVMDAVYEGWYHAGHKPWTTCNDCHTPHAFIPKYLVKAESGYHHVTAFVFGEIPDAIRAKESSRQIVQENCIRCHEETVANIIDSEMAFDRYCYDCHCTSAHGERGLSILPYQHTEENQ